MKFSDENSIKEFKEDYFFLSNFYPHPITFKGILYPSSEHAYVSAKSDDPEFKLKISQTETAGKAKRLGRNIIVIEDWDSKKLIVMEEILRIKFSDETLKEKLLATGECGIYEGNWWHDTFFGVDNITGIGQNNLGRLLMKIRDESKYKSIL